MKTKIIDSETTIKLEIEKLPFIMDKMEKIISKLLNYVYIYTLILIFHGKKFKCA